MLIKERQSSYVLNLKLWCMLSLATYDEAAYIHTPNTGGNHRIKKFIAWESMTGMLTPGHRDILKSRTVEFIQHNCELLV